MTKTQSNQQPRILELCGSRSFGGLEMHFVRFSQWLGERLPTQTFVAAAKDTRIAQALTSTDLHLSGRLPKRLKQLLRYIAEQSIDVMHIHDKNDLPLAVLSKVFSARPIRLVHTRHMQIGGPKKDPYHRFLYKNIDCLITITQEMAQSAQSFLPMPKQRITQTYLGVPPMPEFNEVQRQALRSALGISAETFVCTNIGRIEPLKGQHILVDAIAQLKDQFALHGLFVGEPMNEEYTANLQKRCEHERLPVSWLGFRRDIPALIHASDCIVITTENETFGLIAVEALLSRRLTIGADSGGLKEIIAHEKTGLLYQTFNAQALAQALARSHKEPQLRHQLAKAGQEDAQIRFDETRQFERILGQLTAFTTE